MLSLDINALNNTITPDVYFKNNQSTQLFHNQYVVTSNVRTIEEFEFWMSKMSVYSDFISVSDKQRYASINN